MKRLVKFLLLGAIATLVLAPVFMVFIGSFMGHEEIKITFADAIENGKGMASFSVIPMSPTGEAFYELFVYTPKFFVMFWNSCKQVVPVLAGQLAISVPAAWAFARFRFRCRKLLFILYIILMVMPFQVTMVSNYLVLNKLSLLDTHLAIILPGIFSAFPVFIIQRFFSFIPESVLEAARIDGASEFRIFLQIGVPLGGSGILSAMILGFMEYWNAIEQPLTFLRDKTLQPLSLFLPNITGDGAGISMAASVIIIIPSVLIFIAGKERLVEGIAAMNLKE